MKNEIIIDAKSEMISKVSQPLFANVVSVDILEVFTSVTKSLTYFGHSIFFIEH